MRYIIGILNIPNLSIKMPKTAKIHINIEPELKETAENVLTEMDLNLSQAIRLFLKHVILNREIPFLVKYQVEEITNIKINKLRYKKVSPPFKYLGGKTWLKDKLRAKVKQQLSKNKFTAYCEPFCGGLGAFLSIYDILHNNNIKTVYLNDINAKLINFYEVVNHHLMELIEHYIKMEQTFFKLTDKKALDKHTTKDKEELKVILTPNNDFFNNIVNKYNNANIESQSVEVASYLLFLLTHCFNGIYRENSKGNFNTPYNWEVKHITKNQIINKLERIKEVFNLFNIVFISKNFDKLEYIDTCLYYLDPPYLNEKGMENKYSTCSFNYSNQKLLLELVKNKHFIYSNYYSTEIVELVNEILLLVDVEIVERLNLVSSDPLNRSEPKQEILLSSKND